MLETKYVESLTQVLVIHLLRHYSTVTQTITSENRSLSHIQLQQAINYIHTHLDRDLSLVEIAEVINISPTYFASLFKRAIGTSPHQYVIQQRVERAKEMLSETDLAITLRDSFAYRRDCLKSGLLQPQSLDATVQAIHWNDSKADSLTE